MKSQRIRVRNLPIDPGFFDKTIHVKPSGLLFMMLIIGSVMLMLKPYLAMLGGMMLVLSLFCLVLMPDRILIQFSKEYIVLYNQHDRSYCYIVYWDEIVNWQYEKHNSYNQLVITLIDGSTQVQETYSLSSLRHFMEIYAPGKMKKGVRIWKETA